MNLALDEVLLDSAEGGDSGRTLRFWESPAPFVVLGTGQALAEEVLEENCRADGVPILRRCTAGGCVLQGPGSLNFALALSFEACPEARTLHGSYQWVLGRLAEAFAARGLNVRLEGTCDLAIEGRKVSGNAQRRRRNAILHHGTLLYHADTAAMARYLAEPAKRPGYRGERDHGGFVTALPLNALELRACVRAAFGAKGRADQPTPSELALALALMESKYEDDAWTRRR